MKKPVEQDIKETKRSANIELKYDTVGDTQQSIAVEVAHQPCQVP